MSNEHQAFIDEENNKMIGRVCPFANRTCTSLCIAFISAQSYTIAKNSPFGVAGQKRQSPAKCHRLEWTNYENRSR